MTRITQLNDDEVAQALVEDPDVIMAQLAWAKGHYSDSELLNIMKSRRQWIGETPVEVEVETIDTNCEVPA